MWTTPLLLDSIVVLAVVAICLFIAIQFGVKRPWLQIKPEPAYVRYTVGLLVLASLVFLVALGVIRGHSHDVAEGAVRGAWGGALLGAWGATRKHQKRLSSVGEAFAAGLAETLDAVLVGAVVGGFLISAGEAWKGAFFGAIVGIAGFAFGRMRVMTRSDAPIPYAVSVVVNAWVKLPRLAQKASHEKMAAVTTAMEAVAGALLIGAAMSLFWAATGWWAGLPDFD
jgi:hypothetical protein